VLLASGVDSALRSPEINTPQGVARIVLRLALVKSATDEMWTEARKSYATRLQRELWERVPLRARLGGCLEGGSIWLDP